MSADPMPKDHLAVRGASKSLLRRLALCLAVLGIVAVLVAGYGIWSRQSAIAALSERADDESIPRAEVIFPSPGPTTRDFTLPGTMHAWYEAPLYAQVSGYVHMWYKDYGADVKRGERLATIDAPTLDAQAKAASASLDVAVSRYQLATLTASRWRSLKGTKAVSQQEVDEKTADAKVQQSLVEAARFNVESFAAREAFKNILAPFDGVVTARSTDVGDYVSGSGGDTGTRGGSQLFIVSDVHEMRVFVSIPQAYSDILQPGLTATLTLPQHPDSVYQATYLTSAKAVGPQSLTVTTELTVENPKHELFTGNYVSVHFSVPSDQTILTLPEQALLFRAQGEQVAIVAQDGHVHLQNVKLGLDLGNTVQVISGLKKTDRVMNSPNAGLLEGQLVKPVTPAAGYGTADPGDGKAGAPPSTEPAKSTAEFNGATGSHR